MKRLSIVVLLLLLFFSARPGIAYAENLRIKLGSERKQVVLLSDSGIAKDGAPAGNEIRISAVDAKKGVRYSSPAGTLSVDGRPYRGEIELLPKGSNMVVVNIVDMESYLRGVVPKEIGNDTAAEALKAQAVVSRSFAVANHDKYIQYGYNLEDGTASQAYGGMAVEDPRTDAAVAATAGKVLYYGESVANAIFHATSGGRTESIEDVWGGAPVPYLKGMDDPDSVNTTHSTWTAEFSIEVIQKAFPAIGEPKRLVVLSRTNSGRIHNLRLEGTKDNLEMTGNAFRMKMGSVQLKSTNFQSMEIHLAETKRLEVITAWGKRPLGDEHVRTARETRAVSLQNMITAAGIREIFQPVFPATEEIDISRGLRVRGRGYGHGVGMSQYGAIEMAKKGKTYPEILAFYFPGTRIR